MTEGRHRKPTDTTSNLKKVALGAAIAAGVPLASAGTAAAATDSQWEAVAVPEAGGNWSINHSADGLSVGGLQFQNASWQDALSYLRSRGISTSTFPASLYQGMSNVPTKAQQMLAGEALLHIQGAGAWANGNGSGLGASMFDGGSVPATVAASGLLAGTQWGTGPAPTPPASTNPSTPPPLSHGRHHGHKVKRNGKCHHRTHTVRHGDTLYDITKQHTGDASLDNWKPLYEANKALVGSDPDKIYPGQVLKLPWSTPGAPQPSPQPPGGGVHDDTNGPADPPASVDWTRPVPGGVSQTFHNPGAGYGLGYHTGVDLVAPSGTPVKAVHGGVVVSVNGAGSAYGNHVVIKHSTGVYTLSAHLSSVSVSVGQTVTTGQVVGLSGSTGSSSGPHLHFELRNDPTNYAEGIFSDPIAWLKSHGVNY